MFFSYVHPEIVSKTTSSTSYPTIPSTNKNDRPNDHDELSELMSQSYQQSSLDTKTYHDSAITPLSRPGHPYVESSHLGSNDRVLVNSEPTWRSVTSFTDTYQRNCGISSTQTRRIGNKREINTQSKNGEMDSPSQPSDNCSSHGESSRMGVTCSTYKTKPYIPAVISSGSDESRTSAEYSKSSNISKSNKTIHTKYSKNSESDDRNNFDNICENSKMRNDKISTKNHSLIKFMRKFSIKKFSIKFLSEVTENSESESESERESERSSSDSCNNDIDNNDSNDVKKKFNIPLTTIKEDQLLINDLDANEVLRRDEKDVKLFAKVCDLSYVDILIF